MSRVQVVLPMETVDQSDQEENKIDYFSKIMSFPIILMKIFGLFHHKNDKIYMKIYCIIVLIILWFNFIRLLFNFDSKLALTEIFTFKLLNVLWYFFNAKTQTILLTKRLFTSCEQKLINDFNKLFRQTTTRLRKEIYLIFTK